MSRFTENDLPINDEIIEHKGKVRCQVTASSVHITIKKDETTIVNNQPYSTEQGLSDLFDTTVDNAQWKISVTADNALSKFELTTP